MSRLWPQGFPRIPDEDWTRSPVEELARKYDAVEDPGWYRNLDRTLHDLSVFLRDGQILLDCCAGLAATLCCRSASSLSGVCSRPR